MSGNFQPAKLDIDPSILDSNLMVLEKEDDPFSQLFPTKPKAPNPLASLLPEDEFQSTTVVPKPGLCIKTKNAAGSKFFINLCKLSEIPAPPPIEESELAKLIEDEDYTSLWRVPMSLGTPRKEMDKSGGECHAAEVAVNTSWFEKTMVDSELFTSFVITIAMEGLCDKYGEEARLDRDKWTVLKNKKFLGDVDKCPPHKIQLRQNSGIQHIEKSSFKTDHIVEKEINDVKKGKSMIEELSSKSKKDDINEPQYKIFKSPVINPVQLQCRILLPGVSSAKDICLDVGEDRLVLSCEKTKHSLDVFLPYKLDSNKASSVFVLDEQALNITIPLL